MLRILGLLVLMMSMAVVPAAHAAVIIDSDDAPGTTFDISFLGLLDSASTNLLTALQTFTLDSVTADDRVYTFSYDLANTSDVDSRLRSFGFDVSSGMTIAVARTGAFLNRGLNENFPVSAGRRDVCFAATFQGNCTGGPGGVTKGNSGSGSFSLIFSSSQSSIELSNFVVRVQSIQPSISGADSGILLGSTSSPVPEPATWAMLIVGFASIGGVMRRRKKPMLSIA